MEINSDHSSVMDIGATMNEKDTATDLHDPMKLLTELLKKYHGQREMYRRTSDFYYKLNLWVFFLPILLVQAVTTLFTYSAKCTDVENHGVFKVIVAILNALLTVWAAAQLKLGWSVKKRSANTTFLHYSAMTQHVQVFHLIMDCQHKKTSDGVLHFVTRCYEDEKAIMDGEIPVPSFIAKDYKHIQFTLPEKEERGDKKWAKKRGAGKQSGASTENSNNSSSDKKAKEEAEANNLLAEEDDLPDDDQNLNSGKLLRALLVRFRHLKWVFGAGATYYRYLNLGLFYAPLLILGTVNAILSAIIVGDQDSEVSLVIVKISAIISIVTGLQMTFQWESESTKCAEAHEMYRKLDSEISYRLMLAEQGVPIRRANAFAWKCRQTEDKTMDSIPGVPSWVIKWATDKKSKDPEIKNNGVAVTGRQTEQKSSRRGGTERSASRSSRDQTRDAGLI